MNLVKYVDRYVRIDLTNGFYYQGLVLSVDGDSLELKDKNGNLVTVSATMVNFIREVKNG